MGSPFALMVELPLVLRYCSPPAPPLAR